MQKIGTPRDLARLLGVGSGVSYDPLTATINKQIFVRLISKQFQRTSGGELHDSVERLLLFVFVTEIEIENIRPVP